MLLSHTELINACFNEFDDLIQFHGSQLFSNESGLFELHPLPHSLNR